MAVELGLNRFLTKPPEGETELQKRERRNRERTYLVLFVHDRSLAMQTGRQWMLPEVRAHQGALRTQADAITSATWSATRSLGTRTILSARKT
jgi:hypothetical protein